MGRCLASTTPARAPCASSSSRSARRCCTVTDADGLGHAPGGAAVIAAREDYLGRVCDLAAGSRRARLRGRAVGSSRTRVRLSLESSRIPDLQYGVLRTISVTIVLRLCAHVRRPASSSTCSTRAPRTWPVAHELVRRARSRVLLRRAASSTTSRSISTSLRWRVHAQAARSRRHSPNENRVAFERVRARRVSVPDVRSTRRAWEPGSVLDLDHLPHVAGQHVDRDDCPR